MKKIIVVFGTRPEAIKMCPIIEELRKYPEEIKTLVCVTGQHKEMLDQVLKVFDVNPDYNLSIMKEQQTLFDILNEIIVKIKDVFILEKPDYILVHGDTSTTFASALAAFYLKIPVAHVEAGLRTYDIYSPFPEEFNRQAVSLISKLNFAPTIRAKENLIAEGKKEKYIYVTGNTAIDALKTTVIDSFEDSNLTWAKDSRLIILTSHRRENMGEPMSNIFNAIKKIVNDFRDVKVIFPVHKNPSIQKLAHDIFDECDRVRLVDPLDVIDFHNYMARCYLILTDSGGIQEEAPSLGKPVLVLRNTTERPEGVEAGTLKIVGTDEKHIYNECRLLLENEDEYKKMANSSNPYGDGHASERIVEILKKC